MNEPVAYVDKIWIERPDLVMSQQLDIGRLFMRSGKEIKNYIPLYTHPAKTLTDAEYDNIFANGKRLGVIETEDRFRKAKTLTDEEIIEVWDKMCSIVLDNDKNITEFARAILRKAQEK